MSTRTPDEILHTLPTVFFRVMARRAKVYEYEVTHTSPDTHTEKDPDIVGHSQQHE